MKIKVKQLKAPITRKRTDGTKQVLYKIMQVGDWPLDIKYKVIDVTADFEVGNTTGGTYYIDQVELDAIIATGVEVKVIPPPKE